MRVFNIQMNDGNALLERLKSRKQSSEFSGAED
jgi:hypothetical protein